MTEKQAKEIQNELLNLEAMARALLENAISINKKLESFYSPAPRKGTKAAAKAAREAEMEARLAKYYAKRRRNSQGGV